MRGRFMAAAIVVGALASLIRGEAVEAQIAWREWNEGVQAARQIDRPILVNVCTRWSGSCKRMDRNVYSRSDVGEYLKRAFVPIRLDAEANVPGSYEGRTFTHRSLAAHFRVAAYPTTLFLRPDGEHLISVPGYVEADQFLRLLRYVSEGHLERGVRWDDFEARRRK